MTRPHEQRRPRGEAAPQSTGQDDDQQRTTGVRQDPAPAALFDVDRDRPWTDALHRLDNTPATAGQRDALDGVNSGWRHDAAWALEKLAASGQPFDADDLHRLAGPPLGPSANAVGGIFAAAAAAGLIEAVGYRRSARRDSKGHLLRVWRGVRS